MNDDHKDYYHGDGDSEMETSCLIFVNWKVSLFLFFWDFFVSGKDCSYAFAELDELCLKQNDAACFAVVLQNFCFFFFYFRCKWNDVFDVEKAKFSWHSFWNNKKRYVSIFFHPSSDTKLGSLTRNMHNNARWSNSGKWPHHNISLCGTIRIPKMNE